MALAIPACPVQPDSLVGHLKPEEPALPQLLARVLDDYQFRSDGPD
jgi:hypothetical protein